MSDFELADLGEGRFALSGDMSFQTAEQILRASERSFAQQTNIEVDMSGVRETDSAGLALLLEWIRKSCHSEESICFTGIPEKILAIAETAEIGDLLNRAHSSSNI